jgi:hypothetical protein
VPLCDKPPTYVVQAGDLSKLNTVEAALACLHNQFWAPLFANKDCAGSLAKGCVDESLREEPVFRSANRVIRAMIHVHRCYSLRPFTVIRLFATCCCGHCDCAESMLGALMCLAAGVQRSKGCQEEARNHDAIAR